LAHAAGDAHHGDFHKETSTSYDGSAPRYSNAPGEEEEQLAALLPQRARFFCNWDALDAMPHRGRGLGPRDRTGVFFLESALL